MESLPYLTNDTKVQKIIEAIKRARGLETAQQVQEWFNQYGSSVTGLQSQLNRLRQQLSLYPGKEGYETAAQILTDIQKIELLISLLNQN